MAVAPTSFITDLLVVMVRRETERCEAAVAAAKAAWRRVVDDPALGDASQEAADAWAAVEKAEEPFRDAVWEEKEVLDSAWAADAVLPVGLTLREYEELRRIWETRVARLERILRLLGILQYSGATLQAKVAALETARGELREIVEYIEARHGEVAATRELIALREADAAVLGRPACELFGPPRGAGGDITSSSAGSFGRASECPNWTARVAAAGREAEARDTWWMNRLHDCGLTAEERRKVIDLERQAACGSPAAVLRAALTGEEGILASCDPRVVALLHAIGL